MTADFEQKGTLFRESRGLGRHSREHLRLGPKLAPRFLGRQQPAARRNPNPAASLPPISESPQRRKACIKLWEIAKNEALGAWAISSIAWALREARAANESVTLAQESRTPPLASLAPP
jgi:hypothetical protein